MELHDYTPWWTFMAYFGGSTGLKYIYPILQNYKIACELNSCMFLGETKPEIA